MWAAARPFPQDCMIAKQPHQGHTRGPSSWDGRNAFVVTRACLHAANQRVSLRTPAPANRRQFLVNTGYLSILSLRWNAEAAEGDVKFLEPESSVIGRFVEQADGWQKFETLDFQLEVPPEFQYKEAPRQPPTPGRGRVAPPSAVKADFGDDQGRSVTVVEYSASQIKPTFFQLGDISQYGSAVEVAKLLTPPGAQILATRKEVVQQPERDTGTLIGKVKATPQTIYRFEYQLAAGVRVATAAVARAGKVLLAGAVAPTQLWDTQPGTLRRVVDSFQLTFPN